MVFIDVLNCCDLLSLAGLQVLQNQSACMCSHASDFEGCICLVTGQFVALVEGLAHIICSSAQGSSILIDVLNNPGDELYASVSQVTADLRAYRHAYAALTLVPRTGCAS
jgi:hypothetical protein